MKVSFIDLAGGYRRYAAEFASCLEAVGNSGWYVLGTNVTELETEMAQYVGVSHTIGVASGTDALHLALAGLGVGRGDEVITTPYTFAATLEAIEYVGAKAVLVDIDPDTWNIDAGRIENAITDKTRCLLPVHMFGLPADMRAIMEIAGRHGLKVVEDCAQSLGAKLDDRHTGSFGDAGAYSFYPTKTMGCMGDGGLIGISDAAVDSFIRELRNHGIAAGGEHRNLGFNSRLDELQAAFLRAKLPDFDRTVERRREIAGRYDAALADTAAVTQGTIEGAYHAYGYYTILVDERDAFRAKLGDAGIATAIYYPKPLHMHEYFGRSCRFESLENAERIVSRCVSLPMFPEMTDEEIDYVASTSASLLS